MILTGNEDMRVRKTVGAIHDAFTEMLMEMPFEKITVKALCERALVNKTTFYRYYPTLEDLLEELQWQYAQPYIELSSGLQYPDDLETLVRKFMIYSAEQGPLYDIIMSSGTYIQIMQKVMREMGEERAEMNPPKGWSQDEWLLYRAHVNTAQENFYKAWVQGGRKVPLDQMVELAVSLICHGASNK